MEFELGSIMKLVKRRLLFIIVLCIAAMGVASFVSYYVIKPKYEATASIIIQGDRQQKPINDIMAGQKLVTTFGEIIRSSRIAEEVVKRLQLKMTPEKLLEHVKTRTSSESLLTTVIVTDSNAIRATEIANGFGEAFNENIQSIMGVENVVFLDRAKVPNEVISPKPAFNLVVAFGLALIAGIAISILRELMDKTVNNAKDIQLDLQLPLLGTVGNLKVSKQRIKTKSKSDEGASRYEEECAKIILPGTTEIR
ncbi:YveK family protein [Paenibacillus macquariensis]|uniref:Capsular polysaccharide biosynthesis protein n=1 Tax=Paenibacillus macquariensis TaxID=948756 RepID=A0ABY1JVG0_9BACL|nr:Wzz/FepE/Etk N-terminal domain-containing protein [Paenibacillus macquariensis]MEC0090753.1 Wzz/FepE/Etk N-terminal domain-containing protein [Paenibacillus macquariensis]OAB34498.1 hypothetical protein PMSM_11555 [Paenibacillus macquariensis subsp. macquariensis]SIQ84653.1 Capsular polysaccharide biosynthesis protein [Paenibacillus macquariensis]